MVHKKYMRRSAVVSLWVGLDLIIVVVKTIEELRAIHRPDILTANSSNTNQDKRVCPVESTIYSVDATIIASKLELDGPPRHKWADRGR